MRAPLAAVLLIALSAASLAAAPEKCSRIDITALCSVAESTVIDSQVAITHLLALAVPGPRKHEIEIIPKREDPYAFVKGCPAEGGNLYCDAIGFACCKINNGFRECEGFDWDPEAIKVHRRN